MAIGVGSFAFGFDITGRACIAAGVVIALVDSLRSGRFEAIKVHRDRQPRVYWAMVAALTLLAAATIAMLVDRVS